MCIVCRKRAFKDHLYRLCLEDHVVVMDPKHVMPGRGAYVCEDCKELALKNYRGCLNRAFGIEGQLVYKPFTGE